MQRIKEMIVKNVSLENMTVYIEGKGGRPSYRPILPCEINFIKSLIKDKDKEERLFKIDLNEKKARQQVGGEIRRITKNLDLPISSKCHEFRKYAAQNYFKYLRRIRYSNRQAAHPSKISV